MRTKMLALAFAASLISLPAFAAPGGEGSNTGCNGVGNPNSPCSGTATGGTATSDASAAATAVAVASQHQAQGQLQAQQQVATGGRGGAGGQGGTATATGGQATALGGAASASTGASTSSASSGGNSLSVREDAQARNPVATAYAAPATFSSDTCFASASAGGQGVGLGLSLALPFKDQACERRANARMLQALGEKEAAVIYLSRDKDINAAVTAARTIGR